MGWMAVPTFLVRGPLLVLCIMTCSTVGFIWRRLKFFIGAMALVAFYLCNAMDRIKPFLVYLRSGILMALGTRSEFFLCRKFRMGSSLGGGCLF